MWKIVGDEILFCCRVNSMRHLSRCVTAFIEGFEEYGRSLEREGHYLDIKGAGWLCSFPAPNVTIALDDGPKSADQFDETFERFADENPRSVDFLGNGIDCGFRIAKHSATDRFIMSVELAWLLAEAGHRQIFKRSFQYHGRDVLKGVIRDRPYPLVSIDTERSIHRREVRSREVQLLGAHDVGHLAVRDFLFSFMQDEKIELPHLSEEESNIPSEPPASYENFRNAWLTTVRELLERRSSENRAAEIEDGTAEMPPDLVKQVQDFIDQSRDPTS